MVEVPVAALKAAVFARHVDFLSIGTNDLTQYALAADRNNDAVASIGDTFDPGLLQLIQATCQGAAGQASVSVCGEFAADERAVSLLLGMGVDALSVTPPAIPTVKEAVRAVDTVDAQQIVKGGARQRQRGISAGAVERGLNAERSPCEGKATAPLRWLQRLETAVPPHAPRVELRIPDDRHATVAALERRIRRAPTLRRTPPPQCSLHPSSVALAAVRFSFIVTPSIGIRAVRGALVRLTPERWDYP